MPQDRPRVSQDAEVEVPSMPNGKFRHQQSKICLQKTKNPASRSQQASTQQKNTTEEKPNNDNPTNQSAIKPIRT